MKTWTFLGCFFVDLWINEMLTKQPHFCFWVVFSCFLHLILFTKQLYFCFLVVLWWCLYSFMSTKQPYIWKLKKIGCFLNVWAKCSCFLITTHFMQKNTKSNFKNWNPMLQCKRNFSEHWKIISEIFHEIWFVSFGGFHGHILHCSSGPY